MFVGHPSSVARSGSATTSESRSLPPGPIAPKHPPPPHSVSTSQRESVATRQRLQRLLYQVRTAEILMQTRLPQRRKFSVFVRGVWPRWVGRGLRPGPRPVSPPPLGPAFELGSRDRGSQQMWPDQYPGHGSVGWRCPGGRKAGQPQQLATWAPIPRRGRQRRTPRAPTLPQGHGSRCYAVSIRNPLGLTTPPPQRLQSHRPRLPVGRWLGPRTHGMNSTAAPTRWVMT